MTSRSRQYLHVATAILVIGGLSVATGAAFLNHTLATTDLNLGPTAASLDDAFSQLIGTALGLTLGTAIFACLAWQRQVVSSALAVAGLEGVAAYVLIVAPIFVFTGSGDVSRVELAGDAFVVLIAMLFFVLLGVLIGWVLGAAIRIASLRRSGRGD